MYTIRMKKIKLKHSNIDVIAIAVNNETYTSDNSGFIYVNEEDLDTVLSAGFIIVTEEEAEKELVIDKVKPILRKK